MQAIKLDVTLLLWTALLEVTAVAQPSNVIVRIPGNNPFTEDCLFRERISFLDRSSPALWWQTRTKGVPESDGTGPTIYKVKEAFIRSHQLSTEIEMSLNQAFVKRLESHNKSYAPLRPLVLEEVASMRKYDRSVVLDEMPKKKLEQMLHLYQSEEERAERELIEELDEILKPGQFGDIAIEYMTLDNLYVPLVAHYLDLTEDQQAKVKIECLARLKLDFEMREKFPDLPSHKEACLKSDRWHELNYRPLAHLNAGQFLKVARRLFVSWRTTHSFTARLELLEKDDGLRAKTELKVLGEFYREQAELESKAVLGK